MVASQSQMLDPVEDFLELILEVAQILVMTSRLDRKAKMGFLWPRDCSKSDLDEPPEEH